MIVLSIKMNNVTFRGAAREARTIDKEPGFGPERTVACAAGCFLSYTAGLASCCLAAFVARALQGLICPVII